MEYATHPADGIILAVTDPIILAIRAYEDGCSAFNSIPEADFNALGGEDEVVEMTYAAPLRVLENWNEPAKTMEGAIAALRFALGEAALFEASWAVKPMLAAALGYLEGKA